MFHVEKLIFENGERYPILLNDSDSPHFWVTLFITVNVRLHAQHNTISSYIQALRHFLLWEQINKRDVVKEFCNRKFLTNIDAISIRDHCRVKTRDVSRLHQKTEKRKSVDRIKTILPLLDSWIQSAGIRPEYE